MLRLILIIEEHYNLFSGITYYTENEVLNSIEQNICH